MNYRAEITLSGHGLDSKWAIVYYQYGLATPAQTQYAWTKAGARRKSRKHLAHLNHTI